MGQYGPSLVSVTSMNCSLPRGEGAGIFKATQQIFFPKLSKSLKKNEPLLLWRKTYLVRITLGFVLLGILVWVSYTFFPTGH